MNNQEDITEALSFAHAEIHRLQQILQNERAIQKELRGDRNDLAELVVHLEINLGEVSRELECFHRSNGNRSVKSREREKGGYKEHTCEIKDLFGMEQEHRKEEERRLESQLITSLQREIYDLKDVKCKLKAENKIITEIKVEYEEIINDQQSKILDLTQRIKELEREKSRRDEDSVITDKGINEDLYTAKNDVPLTISRVDDFDETKWARGDFKRRGKEEEKRMPGTISPVVSAWKASRKIPHASNETKFDVHLSSGSQGALLATDRSSSIISIDSIDINSEVRSVLSAESDETDTVPAHHFYSPVRQITNTTGKMMKKIGSDEQEFRHKVLVKEDRKTATSSFSSSLVTGFGAKTRKWGNYTSSTVIPMAICDVQVVDISDTVAQRSSS